MRYFEVTETKTITLIHVIRAENREEAIGLMQGPGTSGLCDILEDDAEMEYEAVEIERCKCCRQGCRSCDQKGWKEVKR